jgi:TetR/AcrR family transcriptional regulator, cholesterol catabolism regulator
MEENLRKIVEKSASLFNKYGIRSISMDDVAKELGISKKTLYQYVSNKNELIEYLLQLEYEKISAIIDDVKALNLNAIDSLLLVSKKISQVHQDNNPSVEYDLIKYYPEIAKNSKSKIKKLAYEQVKINLEQGIKEGMFRSELNSEIVAGLYLQKMDSIMEPDELLTKDFSFSRLFKTMFENHIRGIANEKGIEYFEKVLQSKKFKI